MGGEGGLRGLIQWVQLCTGAQIYFGNLTPWSHSFSTYDKPALEVGQIRHVLKVSSIPLHARLSVPKRTLMQKRRRSEIPGYTTDAAVLKIPCTGRRFLSPWGRARMKTSRPESFKISIIWLFLCVYQLMKLEGGGGGSVTVYEWQRSNVYFVYTQMPALEQVYTNESLLNGKTNEEFRMEILSVILVFSTGFVNYCPSNLVSG